MRLVRCLIVGIALLVGTPAAFALLLAVDGNKPQSAANYERWPGLVDVVNQPSRQMLVWCNGNEWLGYRGETAALNATLDAFAKIDSPTRCVVLRPGPSHGGYDWMLHVSEGASRAFAEQNGMDRIQRLDPYLEVYVSDRLELLSLQFPGEIEVQQLADVRLQYQAGLLDENPATRKAAEVAINNIDRDPIRGEIGADEYDEQLRRIQVCVKKRTQASL